MDMTFILQQLYEIYLDQLGVEADVTVTKKEEHSNDNSRMGVA